MVPTDSAASIINESKWFFSILDFGSAVSDEDDQGKMHKICNGSAHPMEVSFVLWTWDVLQYALN
jgi:hypothetical protein